MEQTPLQRGKAAAVQSRAGRAGDGPLGGSILTGLAVDVGISASVLREQLCVPDPSVCVEHWAAGNPRAWLAQLAGDSPTPVIPKNCYPGLSLGALPHG